VPPRAAPPLVSYGRCPHCPPGKPPVAVSPPWRAGISCRSGQPSIRSRSRSSRMPSPPEQPPVRQVAMAAPTGSSRYQAATCQLERTTTTTLDLHPNLPNCLSPRRRHNLAEVVAPAVATAPLRRPHPPVVSLPQPSAVIKPPRTRGPSLARARPSMAAGWPEFGRSRHRPCPEGHIASLGKVPGFFMRTRGNFVRNKQFEGPARKLLLK
jgi:hypothetical protein